MAKWRRHSVQFKRDAVKRMETSPNINELARELGIQRKLLYTWKYQLEGRPEPRNRNLNESGEKREPSDLERKNKELKQALAEKELEVRFLEGALRRIKELRQSNTGNGGMGSTLKSSRSPSSKAN
jgi:transposase-like protein